MLKKIVLSAMLGSTLFAAHQVGLNVNDKEVEGQLRVDLGRMGNVMDHTYIGGRFLNGDQNHSQTITNIDPLVELSFLVENEVKGVKGLKLGLGIKTEFTSIDNQNYGAIPLGVEGELKLPLNSPVGVYLNGVFYYAPEPLCFRNGDDYTETRVGVDVEPIENARIQVGYRKIDTDMENRDVVYNDSWYFGFRLDF